MACWALACNTRVRWLKVLNANYGNILFNRKMCVWADGVWRIRKFGRDDKFSVAFESHLLSMSYETEKRRNWNFLRFFIFLIHISSLIRNIHALQKIWSQQYSNSSRAIFHSFSFFSSTFVVSTFAGDLCLLTIFRLIILMVWIT